MFNIQYLESKFLDAKIAYYNGKPIISDSEFDALEEFLKKQNSSVVKQVGTKRSEFDFPHPSPMLSLNKIQTEETENGIDFKTEEILKWAEAKCKKIGVDIDSIEFEFSPKYDGNAINVIHTGNKLHKILSRSDKDFGKDLTEKLKHRVQSLNINIENDDVLETRYEAVIKKDVFNKKYTSFANPRNTVAGLFGRDEISDDLNDIDLLPICHLLNHRHIKYQQTMPNFSYHYIYEYEKIMKKWITERENFPYQLDGIVISFPASFREKIGQNDHDPEWSIAIKFIPEFATTIIKDIEFGIGKTGEITPIAILKPVILAGTKVSRVSLYNIGYLLNKKLGKQAVISIQKAGDIIPEVKNVIIPAKENIIIPTVCPSCNSILMRDGVHLICNNALCKSKITKLLDYQFKILKLKGVGQKTIDEFAKKGFTIIDLIEFVRTKGNIKEEIEPFGFSFGSRSHEIFLNVFNSIKTIDFESIPLFLGINNVGKKLAKQIALYYCGEEYSWQNQEMALVEFFQKESIQKKIYDIVNRLKHLGIEVALPKSKKLKSSSLIKAVLTGSPKNFGYKTKEEFINEFNIEESSLSDCKYLITDSYTSTSGKMKVAKEKNIEIITYYDFKNKYQL